MSPRQRVEQLSDKLCECGCGQFTSLAPRTYSEKGVRKGEPRRFVAGHNNGLREVVNPERICGCGCGGQTTQFARYKRGHAPKFAFYGWEVMESGCWHWAGTVGPFGYGVGRWNGKVVQAHRWVYVREVGDIPPRHDLHHTCENRLCVNPAHLEPLPHDEHPRVHAEMRRAA